MRQIGKFWTRSAVILAVALFVPSMAVGGGCSSKLFSATIDSQLSIGDAIENLAETCGLTVIVKDEWARERLKKKLYYVKLKNSTLKGFLNTVLSENDLHYTLNGDKLTISYLTTHTFRVHYIAGHRIGKSQANVTIANSSDSSQGGNMGGGNTGAGSAGIGTGISGSSTGISIESNDEFKFWKTIEDEVQRILSGAADGGVHYTRAGDSWIGPDGTKWEYNPLAPIVNAEAGMITVTGTDKQVSRVERYLTTLKNQIKTEVLIDVRILTVTFDDSTTTGVDWSQLYGLQNLTINSLAMSQKNMATYTVEGLEGITDATFAEGTKPENARLTDARGQVEVSDVVKFLATQGDVKSISSPRVMTLNNQPALISVGKELFYKIKSSTTMGGSGGSTSATEGEYVDSVFAGILLDITPEIDNNGIVTLKINPSISDTLEPIESSTGTRSIPPDLIRRQVASVIKVKDGHHAILGGLITSQTGTNVKKVPLLGDLPLFEYAFKQEEKIDKVIELVLIITPHIIRNSRDVSMEDLGYKRLNGK